MKFVWSYLLLSILFTYSFGARILGVFFCAAYSHQTVFRALYRELAKRGHEVIAVTPNPLNDSTLKNLTEIDTSHIYNYEEIILRSFDKKPPYSKLIERMQLALLNFTGEVLNNEEFKKLYQNARNEKFDLVLVEAISPLALVFGYIFNAPSVGIFSLEASIEIYSALGGVIHPAIYGGMLIDFIYPISTWEKIQNIYYFLFNKYYMNHILRSIIDEMTKDYFGDEFPSIVELQKNLTMFFVARNRVMNSVRPVPPNIVEVDFMQIQEPKPLPKDLEQILNNSTQGVVYCSLGSIIKSCKLPQTIINAIAKGLSDLPYTVLWKWECEEMPNISENVITRHWFPQQDILAHSNVKVFITQGGLQSCEEAIAGAVPLVGIPAIADQDDNISRLVNLGVAVKVPLEDLTPESLTQAVMKIVENKTYSKKMKEIRDICFDQPMTGLERAVWWSEYVIRNKGAPALRSVLADVPLYEYLLLDVISIFLIILVLFLLALRKLIFYINK